MRTSHRASDLKLFLVGKRTFSKATRSISVADMEVEEPWPSIQNPNFCNTEIYDQLPDKSKAEEKYSAMEDTRVSRFTHHKILIVEKNILLLSFLVIFFGAIKL